MTQVVNLLISILVFVFILLFPLLLNTKKKKIAVKKQTGYIVLVYFVGTLFMIFLQLKTYDLTKSIHNTINNIGICLIVLGVLILYQTYFIRKKGMTLSTQTTMQMIKQSPLFILIPTFFSPILEELLLRVALFHVLELFLPLYGAIIVTSLIFMILHFDGNKTSYFFIGLTFHVCYIMTQSILYPILCHIGMNLWVILYLKKKFNIIDLYA